MKVSFISPSLMMKVTIWLGALSRLALSFKDHACYLREFSLFGLGLLGDIQGRKLTSELQRHCALKIKNNQGRWAWCCRGR
jgi:hypothetical protein